MFPVIRTLLVFGLASCLSPARAAGDTGDGPLRGVVRSVARINIATDLAAPIAQAPFREGMAFAKGDLLIGFDCKKQEAEHRAAEANARATQIEYNQKAQLRKYGAAGKGEVDFALAGAERSQAEVDLAAVKLDGCRIIAPFNGRVVERHAGEHEMPQPGTPLLTIVDDSALEIDFVAPSAWLRWLRPQASFLFVVDETGTQHRARIAQIGAEVDAVSQTVRLTGTLEGDISAILPGMSGEARFDATSAIAPETR